MQKQVKVVLQQVTDVVRTWPGIEAITYIPSEDDVLDPYFFIRFDVYTRNGLPDSEKRMQDLHFAGGFETAPFHKKDRFLVHDIPVRLDYKKVVNLPDPDDPATAAAFISREEGTYPMFRISESIPLYEKSDWFINFQESLRSINQDVWKLLQEHCLRRMEHHLSDFGAAVHRNDQIFQKTALAGFIRGLCSSLFAINNKFEPSGRGIQRYLFQLSELPEGFEGRFEVLLENNQKPERVLEIADILTKSILQLAEAHKIY